MGGSVWEIPTHLSVNIFLSPLLHTRAHTCTRQHGWVDMVIILCIGICVCVCAVHERHPVLSLILLLHSAHAPCHIKALLQNWFLCSSFSATEIKNRNSHALWMYFPSRKCAVVGASHWLGTTTCHRLPRLLLASTCGALWRKALLTGPRSPEELLELGEGQCQ